MKLSLKLLIPLALIAVVFYMNTGQVSNVLEQQKADGLLINLAGRQRMLTQMMSKDTLLFAEKQDQKIKERAGIIQKVFDTTLSALIEGGETTTQLAFSKEAMRTIPGASGEVKTQLLLVKKLWDGFRTNMNSVLNSNNPAALSYIVENNVTLLKEMNKAVGMMQKEAESKVEQLTTMQNQNFQIVLAIILIVAIAQYMLIVNPIITMTKVMRNLAAGNFNQKTRFNSADELGVLAKSIDKIPNILQNLTQEIDKIGSSITAGNLDVRVDLSQYQGGFANVPKTVNTLVSDLNSIISLLGSESERLLQASHDLQSSSQRVLDSSEKNLKLSESGNETVSELSQNLSSIAAATEEISLNIAGIAGASEQMSANMCVL